VQKKAVGQRKPNRGMQATRGAAMRTGFVLQAIQNRVDHIEMTFDGFRKGF
jgi:hypothetical protein